RGDSFSFETTLSGLAYARRIERWKMLGYGVELIFLRLATADMAIERVAHRVSLGGHNVPTEVIRRRFDRRLANFRDTYCHLVDYWRLFDNGSKPPLLLEAS